MNNEITIYKLIGLIKDGKAPKKICYQGNYLEFDGEDYKYYEGADTLSDDSLVKYIAVGNLKDTVEILPQKNDEWEDIEEYDIGGPVGDIEISLDYLKNVKCTNVEALLAETINKLIKNQKRIIEKLESKDD